jgi:hypothetical protein
VLIYNQCSPELKNKLKGTSRYDKAKAGNNVIKLLSIIRGYCCQFDTFNDEYMSIVKSLKNLFYFFQKAEQTNSEFHEDFTALVKVIEEYGGAGLLTHFPNMIRKELSPKNNADMNKAMPNKLKEAKNHHEGQVTCCPDAKWGQRSQVQQAEARHGQKLRDWNKQIP